MKKKQKMKIWLISSSVSGYDTYDSAVVVAETEELARNIHPSGRDNWDSYSWENSPDKVDVEYLGDAVEGSSEGLVCNSFNAG